MFYPIQVPYILNAEFSQRIQYIEEPADDCGGFAICYWEMQPRLKQKRTVSNIIVADACIDLVVNFDEKHIGFAGMSKTEFNFEYNLPSHSFGVRMMPGAFYQITGLLANTAMDNFLTAESVFNDFSCTSFFTLPYDQAKEYFRKATVNCIGSKSPDEYTKLFDTLSIKIPETVATLCAQLHLSRRQCQRLFQLHYGITPKMALSIVRFHKCLKILTSPQAKVSDVLDATDYYDQPHFQNDFKHNIGITPLEFLCAYQFDAFLQYKSHGNSYN